MQTTDPAELRAWLALAHARLPRRSRLDLLRLWPDPASWFDESGRRRIRNTLHAPQADALEAAWLEADAQSQRTLTWLQEQGDRHLLTLGSPAYPEGLLNAPDPPLLLYCSGQLQALQRMMVAVVGSRSASPQGMRTAQRLGRAWASGGLCIVSGLAVGIDAAAHEGGLEAPGGTVAVVGCGLDETYPRKHLALRQRIEQSGCILSEYPLGTPALPAHFPARNRIIAGLSQAVIVVEAALRSGSLITARLANEAGREVLAVPGALSSSLSAGPHWLIRQGATLLQQAEDLYETLPRLHPQSSPAAQNAGACSVTKQAQGHAPGRHWIAKQLRAGPRSLDELIAAAGRPAASCHVELLEAELRGDIVRLAGGLYQWMG